MCALEHSARPKSEAYKKEMEEKFFKRVKEQFKDKYDFSNSVYKGVNEKIEIKCKKCGTVFEVYARNTIKKQH